MTGDMSLVLLNVINSVLGPKLRAELNEERFNLENLMIGRELGDFGNKLAGYRNVCP